VSGGAGPLAGQVAVITGGGSGVGRGVVDVLAQAGMSVAVIGRSRGTIETAAAAARRHGAAAVAIPADVTNVHDVETMTGEVLRRFGAIDVLVNNAGRARAVGPPWEADPEDWWSDVEVNLRGTFLCSRAALRGMIARGRGRIVNVTSLAAGGPFPYASGYAGSKAAVLHLTESLAVATRAAGLAVFAMSPGLVRTSLLGDLADSPQGRRWIPELEARPASDYVSAAAAGRLVAALASGAFDRLSGRFVHVSDDLDELIARTDQILSEDRRVLRMTQ
jgi:NAD(P)-dependent dehydrogenase (short-subunit alcohol dehydrogenase family)